MGRAASTSRTRNASMRPNAFRFAAGLALVAFGAPFPASGQYAPPPALIIVPPPAQDYATPKPAPKPPPAKPKPPDAPPPTKATGGHYEGRTFVPD
jgi:hypothetical protein